MSKRTQQHNHNSFPVPSGGKCFYPKTGTLIHNVNEGRKQASKQAVREGEGGNKGRKEGRREGRKEGRIRYLLGSHVTRILHAARNSNHEIILCGDKNKRDGLESHQPHRISS